MWCLLNTGILTVKRSLNSRKQSSYPWLHFPFSKMSKYIIIHVHYMSCILNLIIHFYVRKKKSETLKICVHIIENDFVNKYISSVNFYPVYKHCTNSLKFSCHCLCSQIYNRLSDTFIHYYITITLQWNNLQLHIWNSSSRYKVKKKIQILTKFFIALKQDLAPPSQ